MSTNIITPSTTPIIVPLNSMDVSSSSLGSVNFLINYDSVFTNGANVFQIEYWIYDTTADELEPLNQDDRFISVEVPYGLQQSGITNQNIFGVPNLAGYDYYNTNILIKARVYATDNSTGDILLSAFSSPIPFHNCPPQPSILQAYLLGSYYYPDGNTDALYLQLAYTAGDYDLSVTQFFVSMYYTDEGGNPLWNVSEKVNGIYAPSLNLIALDPVVFATNQDVQYPNPNVRVAVNAVYQYQPDSITYSSVSQISSTVSATWAEYEPPQNLTYTYNIYDPETPVQTITLSWTAPQSSTISDFAVASYNVYVSINGGPEVVYNTGNDDTNYTYNVSGSCGDVYTFYVTAVFEAGAESGPSNSQVVNYFEYPEAPVGVNVIWCNKGYNTNDVDMAISWSILSSDLGCDPAEWKIEVCDISENVLQTIIEPYVSPSGPGPLYLFSKFLNDVDVSTNTEGIIKISLGVTNSNNTSQILYGQTQQNSWSVNELPFIYDQCIDISNNEITFKVVSDTILDYVAQFVFFTTQLESQPYYTTNSNPYGTDNSVVIYTPSSNIHPEYPGEFVYEFTIKGAIFDGGVVPNNVIITVANTEGIRAEPATECLP